MRLYKCQYLLLGALLANIIVLYYFWKLQNSLDRFRSDGQPQGPSDLLVLARGSGPSPAGASELHSFRRNSHSDGTLFVDTPEEIAKLVTVVFRDFEFFENDITETIQSFTKVLPDIRIVVLADSYPYPPIEIQSANKNVRIVVLQPRIDEPSNASKPELYIKTLFVLLVPDSIRLTSTIQIREMISQLVKNNDRHSEQMVAAKVSGEKAKCMKLEAKLREWTLESKGSEDRGAVCDAVQGTNVLMMRTKKLLDLSRPFARPLPHALFVQTVVRHWKVRIVDKIVFQRGRPLFLDNHLKWKHGKVEKERLKVFYEDVGIKKVVRNGGDVEWYGCNKATARCFRTVTHDMPEYLFAKRWTPPCCLEGLRETAKHVFKTLRSSGVRYWLEGGSLLGAARNGDIIPWDYDVDIGIYEDDVRKCEFLRDSVDQPVITQDGFVWEKASEGDFYRVQYSQSNHLHVDIFPFFFKDGIMTKRFWFKTHKQDVEFPEHYLRPMSTINFVGIEASAPNNIREFLELKFGDEVIETPQYPNPKLVSFPNISLSWT